MVAHGAVDRFPLAFGRGHLTRVLAAKLVTQLCPEFLVAVPAGGIEIAGIQCLTYGALGLAGVGAVVEMAARG